MNWLIIAVLIILVLVFIKIRYIKHKVFLILFVLILLFFYITSSRILDEYNINWKSVAGIEKATKVYFAWLGGTFNNLKVITANTIKMDWAMKNKTETAVRVIEEKEENKK